MPPKNHVSERESVHHISSHPITMSYQSIRLGLRVAFAQISSPLRHHILPSSVLPLPTFCVSDVKGPFILILGRSVSCSHLPSGGGAVSLFWCPLCPPSCVLGCEAHSHSLTPKSTAPQHNWLPTGQQQGCHWRALREVV